MLYAGGLGVEPAGPGRKVRTGMELFRTYGLGVEHADIGRPSLGQTATALEPVEPGRNIGQLVDRVLETDKPAVTSAGTEKGGGTGEGVDHVEMGTGIRPPDHHPLVLPDLGTQLPTVLVITRNEWRERGPQVLVDRKVAEYLEGGLATLGGHLAQLAPGQFLVGGLEGLGDGHVLPIGQKP